TFMDAPQKEEFDQNVLQNSTTMDLLNRIHMPGLFSNRILDGLLDNDLYRELFSFNECGGFYSGNAFLTWFRQKLNAKGFDPDVTWKNFANSAKFDVSVVTSDVDEHEMVVLNPRTAPDVPVALSVRMSMSIPFVWKEIVWNANWGKYRARDKAGHK